MSRRTEYGGCAQQLWRLGFSNSTREAALLRFDIGVVWSFFAPQSVWPFSWSSWSDNHQRRVRMWSRCCLMIDVQLLPFALFVVSAWWLTVGVGIEKLFYFCLSFFLLLLPSLPFSFPFYTFFPSFIYFFSLVLSLLFFSPVFIPLLLACFLFSLLMNLVLCISFPSLCTAKPFSLPPHLDGPSLTLIFFPLFFFISCVRGGRRFWRAA